VQFQAAADQVSLSLSYLFITYSQTRKYLAKLEHIICRTKVQITVSPLLLQWHVRSLRISRKNTNCSFYSENKWSPSFSETD